MVHSTADKSLIYLSYLYGVNKKGTVHKHCALEFRIVVVLATHTGTFGKGAPVVGANFDQIRDLEAHPEAEFTEFAFVGPHKVKDLIGLTVVEVVIDKQAAVRIPVYLTDTEHLVPLTVDG